MLPLFNLQERKQVENLSSLPVIFIFSSNHPSLMDP